MTYIGRSSGKEPEEDAERWKVLPMVWGTLGPKWALLEERPAEGR